MSFLLSADPRDTRITASALHHAAVRYLERHAAMHLDDEQLLHACSVELVAEHGVEDAHRAHAIAVTALADIQSRTIPAWIDISLSTSNVARVVNPVTGKVAIFTASELVRLAEDRAEARSRAGLQEHPGPETRSLN